MPSPLLGVIPLELVATDRLPHSAEEWKLVDFVLWAPDLPSFELPAVDLVRLQNMTADAEKFMPGIFLSHRLRYVRVRRSPASKISALRFSGDVPTD